VISFDEITRLIPHRYPFLFVDRVLELDAGKRIRCLKNVTGNEYFFPGHFADLSLMPGTIMVEALAQCGLLLFRAGTPQQHPDKVFLLGAVDARFLRPVIPGDQLVFDVVAEKVISTAAIVRGVALVDGEPVARAKLTFAAVDRGGFAPSSRERRPA
jgi:3-hydroxyacyl-[acyl-carrier-protein] dehydratase